MNHILFWEKMKFRFYFLRVISNQQLHDYMSLVLKSSSILELCSNHCINVQRAMWWRYEPWPSTVKRSVCTASLQPCSPPWDLLPLPSGVAGPEPLHKMGKQL